MALDLEVSRKTVVDKYEALYNKGKIMINHAQQYMAGYNELATKLTGEDLTDLQQQRQANINALKSIFNI